MNDVNAVVLAQAYIKAHHTDAEFGIESVCRAVGYSRRQLDRLFQKHMHMTLYEYINAVLLSESAAKLLETDNEVIDVAFDCHYQSHEGYTRSFAKRFLITPKEYRKRKIAIPIFTQHPVNHYYILKGGQTMETTAICTVTPVTRPKRKLIYLPSHTATGYFDYCEEMREKAKLRRVSKCRSTMKNLCLTDTGSQSFRNVSCFTFKVSRMRIPMISEPLSDRF